MLLGETHVQREGRYASTVGAVQPPPKGRFVAGPAAILHSKDGGLSYQLQAASCNNDECQ